MTVPRLGAFGQFAFGQLLDQTEAADVRTPASAQLLLSSVAPFVILPRTITPAHGDLTLSSVAPTITLLLVTSPASADLVLSSVAPVVALTQRLTPASADLTLTSTGPSLDYRIPPAQVNLTLSSVAPTLSFIEAEFPAAADLVLSTTVPVLQFNLLTQQGNLTLSSVAPESVQTLYLVPPACDLVLSSDAAVVTTPFIAFAPWTRGMHQVATYWAPVDNDAFGAETAAPPITVLCRWEDLRAQFRNLPGEERQSNAIVYPVRKLELGGYLALGDRTAIPDPVDVDGAFEIRRVGMSAAPLGDRQLNKVWL